LTQLIRHFDAVPSAMALYRNGKELSDDDATMEFYKVMPQDILELGLRSPKELKERKRKNEGPEIGFSGTGLLINGGFVKDHPSLASMSEGWDEAFARRLQDEENEEGEDEEEATSPMVLARRWLWTCPQCTFLNQERDTCEMCEFTPKA
jgi:hypothetical protein